MSHPIFHIDEEARIGPAAYDRRMVGRLCTINRMLPPLGGEHRYAVSTKSGMHTIVLESTLRKQFERGRWCDISTIWRPNRISPKDQSI